MAFVKEKILNKVGLGDFSKAIANIVSTNYITKTAHQKEINDLKTRMTEIEKHYLDTK